MRLEELEETFDRLWPITRSITGPGFVRSIEILREKIPFDLRRVPTGTKVFDWTVPKEWELISATLSTEKGEPILSTEDSNLHVLNFSEPFKGIVSRDELWPHLHSMEQLKDAVPYVTSYYKPNWGMCISETQRQEIASHERFMVDIDTRHFDGHLVYGDYLLPGESDDEILITSYLCHPSMANNELSGPLAMLGLYDHLKSLPHRKYSYRFLIWPETIGSLAYLATTPKCKLERIVGGIVLTCLGGPSPTVSFKHSRRHWLKEKTLIDDLVECFAANDSAHFEQRQFTPAGGSDERQLCSPGINLPVVQAARTVYGEYPEYHTSLDDKAFMGMDTLADSISKLFLFCRALEICGEAFYPTVEGGEPMLSKYDLYPTVNSPTTRSYSSDGLADSRLQRNIIMTLLSLVDGTRDFGEIAKFTGSSNFSLVPILEVLLQQGLIRVR